MGQVRLFPSSLKGKHNFMVVLQKTDVSYRVDEAYVKIRIVAIKVGRYSR
jgi:hypothetical protein